MQSSIFPPTLLEVDFRLRLALSTDTGQYQVEVVDPITRELLAMRSRPPHEINDWAQPLAEVWTWLEEALTALLNPEPF